jgi:hypothetical protein
MAVSFDLADPRHLTPEQRLDNLAAILAAGARRLLAVRATAARPTGTGIEQIPLESCEIPLEVSPLTRLHGTRPVNATGEPRRRCTRQVALSEEFETIWTRGAA